MSVFGPGARATTTRAFTAADLREFAAVSGHGTAIDHVPEALVGALFSYLLGVRLPGPGTMYLKQESRFHDRAVAGEALTAQVEITRLRPNKHLVDLATTCTGAGGRRIASGRALVYVRDATGQVRADD